MSEPRPTFPKRQRTPREHVVKIRLSEAERQRLETLAEASDYTLAALLRDQFGKVTIRNRVDEKRRNDLLQRINTNLNMIAKWVNTFQGEADTVRVLTHLAAIEREVALLRGQWEGPR
jgi:hypothetical protein